MLLFAALMVTCFGSWPIMGQFHRAEIRSTLVSRGMVQAELLSIGKRSMSMTLRRKSNEFPESKFYKSVLASRTILATPMLREGTPIGVIIIRRRKSVRFRKNKSLCSRLSPIRRSSPSRTCGCSKSCKTQRRIARGARAPDCDVRGARHHQPLADRRAAGARRYRRECRPGLWD